MNTGLPDDSESITPVIENPASENASLEDPTVESADHAQASAAHDASAETPSRSHLLSSIVRGKGPLAARGLGIAKPDSPSPAPMRAQPAGRLGSPQSAPAGATATAASSPRNGGGPKPAKQPPRPRLAGESSDDAAAAKPIHVERQSKVAVPNLRQGLSADLMAELEAELAATDVDAFLSGNAGMASRKEGLEEGQRVHGTILKIHDDSVFVSLGGPDEGVVPLVQFTTAEPVVGEPVEVIIRGLSRADGLYVLTLPGEAIDVSDWADIEDGTVVEATITAANSGGLECTVGGIRGFIPISQISEHRIEDTSEFVDQKMVCVVTESNPRRGNLVLSRRAVLERERSEKKKEQLEQVEAGDLLEGTVRTIKDFGAFVDLGGLEGLIHISKLSWERIKHPSEVLEVGQKVRVKIDKVDKQTGKMSLSYRDTLENPWDAFANSVAAGVVMPGTITRLANFGAFVRLAPGIEGLVHISEVASHRVSNVQSILNEGQEVEVKVLSVDRDSQKIALSIKQALHKAAESLAQETAEEDIPVREPLIKAKHTGPLRGGNDRIGGGERFGLRW